ncbi:hypothetical protein F5148DRAFT_1276836 [Russula earlei]|uniref:Uncharacterized protein n=1 Tax=Russula earlei TaxID=71964 RepID=A0ACC0U4M6_9AGAM|nr:hypothetical protein F5148DRAFT_1276836 [Russula earlei]
MTRYTNVGRKRTYLQASLDPGDDQTALNVPAPDSLDASHPKHEGGVVDALAESRRKRRRHRKSGEPSEGTWATESAPSAAASDGDKKGSPVTKSESVKVEALSKPKAKDKPKRAKTFTDRAASTEARRLKRMAGRRAQTTCFACRQVGHPAKDCPSVRPGADREGVGICYRCGSRKHNLARCREPARPGDPLPFASCFVCSGRGHLASACPRNNGKGVYPNGGSCKLCGETSHLAKDCTLRKIEGNAVSTLLGTGREAGADEDDFHAIRRKNVEMDRDERGEARVRKEAKVRAGALTGVVRAFGKAPVKPQNVVYF